MADIESLGYELVYKAAEGPKSEGNKIEVRSELRALVGMQKEALVTNPSDRSAVAHGL